MNKPIRIDTSESNEIRFTRRRNRSRKIPMDHQQSISINKPLLEDRTDRTASATSLGRKINKRPFRKARRN